MKFFTFLVIFTYALTSFGWDTPELPDNWCKEVKCTKKMLEINKGFLKSKASPFIIPAMYSGECYFLADDIDPNLKQFFGVMFDYDAKFHYFMAPVFQAQGDVNQMSNWNLDKARIELSDEWRIKGIITNHPTTFSTAILTDTGSPLNIFWARQNKISQKLYLMAYISGFGNGLCEANENR